MKKRLLAVLLYAVLHSIEVYGVCKTEACKRAVAWKSGYTAIILDDDIPREDYFKVLHAIRGNKGVVAIEADSVVLGWVPNAAAGKIRATRGVRAVVYDKIVRPADLVRREQALPALEFFNHVVTGAYEDAIEAGLAAPGPPLTGCVLPKDYGSPQAAARSVGVPLEEEGQRLRMVIGAEQVGLNSEHGPELDRTVLPQLPPAAPHFDYAPPHRNPDMKGRVTVQLFTLDSDGTVDPNLYTWTDADRSFARNQAYGAFTFWVNEANARGVTPALSFSVQNMDPFSRYKRFFVSTSTRYEPIIRPEQTDHHLWVNDALTPHGYGLTGSFTRNDVYNRNEAFNLAQLSRAGGPFDRSFTVYIVYNPPPAPATFPNDLRAYAHPDGPFTTVMWNSGGWGPNNLGVVLSHETGHIFWACDEYHDAATNTGCFTCGPCYFNVGPRNQLSHPHITNANCENPAGGGVCNNPRVDCMMRRGLIQTLCPQTPGQLGW